MEDAVDKKRKTDQKYFTSEKGRAAIRRYLDSEAGKEALKRYFASEKGRAAQLKHYHSPTGKAWREQKKQLDCLLKQCSDFLKRNPDQTAEDFLRAQQETSD